MVIAVVGGGIVGMCTSRALAQRGAQVILIESGQTGSGASATNAGWIAPSLAGPLPAPGLLATSLRWLLRPDSPLWIRPRLDPAFIRWMWQFRGHMNPRHYQAGLEAILELSRQTMSLFDGLANSGLVFEMHADGVVMAYSSVKAFEHGLREVSGLSAFGYAPGETATGGAVRDLDPALGEEIKAAFVVEGERHVDPISVNAALLGELGRLEVEVRSEVPVTGFAFDGGRVSRVETGATTIDVDAVVIAAGAGTRKLTSYLGVALPVEAGKGYSVDISPAPVRLRRPVYLHEERVAVTPLSTRLRMAGTMELGGRSETISMTRVRAIERSARRLLSGWPEGPVSATYGSGLRPVTPDGLPVIGPLPRFDNVWVASGHAMLGLTLAPATAEIVAEGVLSGIVPPVARPFLPARFAR